MATLPLPTWLKTFYSQFPLYIYPDAVSSPVAASKPSSRPIIPILYVHPPKGGTGVLSCDVECLKWQAYLALRVPSHYHHQPHHLNPIHVRTQWDLSPDGAVGGILPNLFFPVPTNAAPGMKAELLEAARIPSWVNGQLGTDMGALEGYVDEERRDESRAWIALLEGDVHAALLLSQPKSVWSHLDLLHLNQPSERSTYSHLHGTTASVTGITSILPPIGTKIHRPTIMIQYRESIESLSIRLGTDKWFLGSRKPTALDALAFAYVYTALNSDDEEVRKEVQKWVNLVAWERKVQVIVKGAMHTA